MHGFTLLHTGQIAKSLRYYAKLRYDNPMQALVDELIVEQKYAQEKGATDLQLMRTITKIVTVMLLPYPPITLPMEYRGHGADEIARQLITYATNQLLWRRPTWVWASAFAELCLSRKTLAAIGAEINGDLWQRAFLLAGPEFVQKIWNADHAYYKEGKLVWTP